MEETLIIIGIFLWYILSLVISDMYGKSRKPGTEWLFFICMVASPLVGFLVSYYLGKKDG